MQTQGNLQGDALYDLLREVSRRRETGILTVQGENDIVAVTFLDGRVVAADAMNETMEEGLGQVLASQGLVSPEKFEQVVSRHQASGERVSDLLLEQKLIGRTQILEAMRLQTYRVLLELLRWQQGEYNLFLGEEISYEDGVEAMSVEELLMRSISDLGSAGQLSGTLPDLDGLYERKPRDTRPIKVLGQHGDDPGAEPLTAWVSPNEALVLNSTDGKTSGSAMIAILDLDDYQVQFALYRLVEMGLIQLRAGSAPRRSAEELDQAPAPPAIAVAGTPPPDQRMQFDQISAVSFPEPPELPAVAPRAPSPPKRREDSLSAVGSVWITRAVALVLGALLILLVAAPASRTAAFFPFSWQSGQRLGYEGGQRAVIYTKITRAVDTYYLLYGRYPEELGILVDMELLSSADLYDPRGRWLDYAVVDTGYRLEPIEGGEPVAGLDTAHEVSGNFLLNPQFVAPERQTTRRAVRLLD